MAAFSKSSTILVNENGLGFIGAAAAAATAAPDEPMVVVVDGAVKENPGVLSAFFEVSVDAVEVVEVGTLVVIPFVDVPLVDVVPNPNTNGVDVVEAAVVVAVVVVAVEVVVDVVGAVVADIPNENAGFEVLVLVEADDDGGAVDVFVVVVPNENAGFAPVVALLLEVAVVSAVVLPKLNDEAGVVAVLVGVAPNEIDFVIVGAVAVVELGVLNAGIDDELAAEVVLKVKADVNVEAGVVAGALLVVAGAPPPKLNPDFPVVVVAAGVVVVACAAPPPKLNPEVLVLLAVFVFVFVFVVEPKLKAGFVGVVLDGLVIENADVLVFKFCCCCCCC